MVVGSGLRPWTSMLLVVLDGEGGMGLVFGEASSLLVSFSFLNVLVALLSFLLAFLTVLVSLSDFETVCLLGFWFDEELAGCAVRARLDGSWFEVRCFRLRFWYSLWCFCRFRCLALSLAC